MLKRSGDHYTKLLENIANNIELPELLGMVGKELKTYGGIDGYLIALITFDGKYIVVKKIELPEDFKGMETAYQDYQFPLAEDNAVVRSFNSNKKYVLNRETVANEPEIMRVRFERWRMNELAVMPIPDSNGKPQGVVMMFVNEGHVEPSSYEHAQDLLNFFSKPIHNSRDYYDLQQQEEDLRAAAAERKGFLDMIGHITELSEAEQIYEVITREFLDWWSFDMCAVWMQEENELNIRTLACNKPSLQGLRNELEEYYKNISYVLEVSDSATSMSFLNNQHVYLHDVEKVLHLPMSEKDKAALNIMKTPRTFLFVPIRRKEKPIGMLWLLTLEDTLAVTENDISLVDAVCGVIGTAMGNAQLYSTVEQQRHAIEKTLNELKATQAQLQEAEQAKLEALVHSKEAAEASASAKSAFVANTSHEIRTPLTAIMGFAETLHELAPDHSEEERWSASILRNSKHLLGLINDILDVSKIEAGRIELERIVFPPLDLISDLEATVAMLIQAKNLTFYIDYEFPLPNSITSDPTRLRQILLNLLNNAIKFTHEGEVRLRVSCDRANQKMQFSVTDSGIGMRADDIQNLFQPFTQVDASTTRRYGGTGLGLTIARELAQLMGGHLSVSSQPGVGSDFSFDIATGDIQNTEWVDHLTAKTESTPVKKLEKPPMLEGKILIADDSSDNRELISLYIRNTGATPVTTRDGLEAVNAAKEEAFNLVLLDVQMPTMSGIEAVQEMKQMGVSVPIIALTANVGRDDIETYRQVGFDGHHPKPIDRPEFYQLLSEHLPEKSEAPAEEEPATQEFDIADIQAAFLERLPQDLETMRGVMSNGDWQELARLAHRLKGIAGSLGRPDVTVAAAALERAALDSNDVILISDALNKLCALA
ncbi:MAG: response regulator [Agarilytica sp.]